MDPKGETGRSGERRSPAVPAIVVVSIAWALWYVASIALDPYEDASSLYLTAPLAVLLVLTGAIVLWGEWRGAVRVREDAATWSPAGLRLMVALPLLVAAIWLVGVPLAGAGFVAGFSWVLGERRPIALLALFVGAVAIILGGFWALLGVPMPVRPLWGL